MSDKNPVDWVNDFASRVKEIMDDKKTVNLAEYIFEDALRIKRIIHELLTRDSSSEKNILPELPAIVPMQKDPAISDQHRVTGQQFHEANDPDNAHRCYTEAIANALPSSQQHFILHNLRSQLFFKEEMYNECFAEIKRIKNLRVFSRELKNELLMRKKKCHDQFLEILVPVVPVHSDSIGASVEQENPFVPGLSNKALVAYSPTTRRHVIANEDIPVGHVIGVQKPYVSSVRLDSRYCFCWYCTKQTWASKACEFCENCFFCSEECQEKAWHEFHDIECSSIRQLKALGVSPSFLMPMKLAIKGIKEHKYCLAKFKYEMAMIDAEQGPLRKGLIDDKLEPNRFASIYALYSTFSTRKPEKSSLHFTHGIMVGYVLSVKLGLLKPNSTRRDRDLKVLQHNDNFIFLVALVEKLMRVVLYNNCVTTMPMMNCTMNLFNPSYSITPAFCFFNHSCDRSFVRTSRPDGSIVLTAIRPIKRGDEIFDSYDALDFTKHKTIYRQEQLYKKFGFACSCPPCIENWIVTDSKVSADDRLLHTVISQLEKLYYNAVESRMGACEHYVEKKEILELKDDVHKKLKYFIQFFFSQQFPLNSKHLRMAIDAYSERLLSMQVPLVLLKKRETTEL